MITTPLTRHAQRRVEQHQIAANTELTRAKLAREALANSGADYLAKPTSLVWVFAAGAWIGSRRKVIKIIETPTKTVKSGTSPLSVINTALSLLALKYKTKNIVGAPNPAGDNSDFQSDPNNTIPS